MVAPKGTPKPILEKLQQVFGEAAKSPEYKKFNDDNFGVATWIPGEEAVKAYDNEQKVYRPIFEKEGLLKEAK